MIGRYCASKIVDIGCGRPKKKGGLIDVVRKNKIRATVAHNALAPNTLDGEK